MGYIITQNMADAFMEDVTTIILGCYAQQDKNLSLIDVLSYAQNAENEAKQCFIAFCEAAGITAVIPS